MFGGLALCNQLLCHGYSDTRGRVRLIDVCSGRVRRHWSFGGGEEGWAEVGGLCLEKDSTLLVADPETSLVRRFTLFGVPLGQVGTPGDASLGSRDRRGAIVHPNDVTLDGQGNLYVCCGDRPMVHGVHSFTPQGRLRRGFRAFGEPLEEWGLPMGLSVAGQRLYVADTFNQCIQVHDLEGGFRMMFSTAQSQGERSLPVAVAVRPSGELLVAQWKDRPAILRFDCSGWYLGDLVGPGKEEGRVSGPTALALDGAGSLFVLDFSGERIQHFDANGALLRVLSSPPGR